MGTVPKPKSRSTVSRFLYGMNGVSFLAFRFFFFLGVLGLVFILALPRLENLTIDKIEVLYGAATSFGLALVCGIYLLMNRRKVTCPLCRVSLFFGHKSLVKRGSKRVFGSPKTAIAFSVSRGSKILDCPYCAERVRLQRDIE